MNPADILRAIERGDEPSHAILRGKDAALRRHIVERVAQTPAGRSWLRRDPHLDEATADALLFYRADFRQSRRNASLSRVVERARLDVLLQCADSVAGGPAAIALWNRLSGDTQVLVDVASAAVVSSSVEAAEATLTHLVLDPVNAYSLTETERGSIAKAALRSAEPAIRGLAAEYLSATVPELLLASFEENVRDPSERVRGVTWLAALDLARDDAARIAIDLVYSEAERVAVRRSALIAIGFRLPTNALVDVLSVLVVHPEAQLANDAAELLFNRHRHPVIAEAARHSPHDRVREIAERLLDPNLGSPAAGGSRPRDPTRQDVTAIFSDMIRRIEDRTECVDDG